MARTNPKISIFCFALLLTNLTYSQSPDQEALQAIEDTLKKAPQNTQILILRGMTHAHTKKYEAAIADFSVALRMLASQEPVAPSPNHESMDSLDVLIMRAHCYESMNAVEQAVSDYRLLQAKRSNDFMISIAVARTFTKHKEFVKAQQEIDRLKKFPENERGLVYQAILFYESGKYGEASRAIDTALLKYPNSIEGLVCKAKIFHKLNKISSVCSALDEARRKLNPEYFGGEYGYQRDFEMEICSLTKLYCQQPSSQ